MIAVASPARQRIREIAAEHEQLPAACDFGSDLKSRLGEQTRDRVRRVEAVAGIGNEVDP